MQAPKDREAPPDELAEQLLEQPPRQPLVSGTPVTTASEGRLSGDSNQAPLLPHASADPADFPTPTPPSPTRLSALEKHGKRVAGHQTPTSHLKHVTHKRTPRAKSEPMMSPGRKQQHRVLSSQTVVADQSLKAWAGNFLGRGRHGNMQFRCFLITFCAYGSTFMLRTPISVIRNDVHTDLSIPVPHLGWMDTAMLLPLGILQIILSGVKLPYGPRQLISYSLIGGATSMIFFGVFHSYAVLLVCLFFSGAFQALVFPQCINALSQWYTDAKIRTTVFGVWGACSALGGLLATAQATGVRTTCGWHHVYWIPSALSALIGLVVLKFLRLPSGTSSMQLNLLTDNSGGKAASDDDRRHLPGSDDSGSEATDNEMLLLGNTYANAENRISQEEEEQVERSVTFSLSHVNVSRTLPVSQLVRIPLVKEVATIYFFVNLLRFAIYMWLPIFLHTVVGYDKNDAGWVSMFFETGALLGVPGVAILSDKLLNGKKILAMQIALAFSAGSLLAFYFTARLGMFFNCIFLVMVGFASGGTDMVLTGSVAVDLGGKFNCIPGVAGIINGFGVLGAVLQGGLIANTYFFAGRTGLGITLGIIAFVPVWLISRVKKLDLKSQSLVPFMRGRNTYLPTRGNLLQSRTSSERSASKSSDLVV